MAAPASFRRIEKDKPNILLEKELTGEGVTWESNERFMRENEGRVHRIPNLVAWSKRAPDARDDSGGPALDCFFPGVALIFKPNHDKRKKRRCGHFLLGLRP
jgi:hypothetical protein